MLKAFKYKIYPTKEQKTFIHQHFGAVRFVYNYFLDKKINFYKENKENKKKSLNRFECSRMLTVLKKEEDYKWLSEVSSRSLMQSLINLENAYKHFFRRLKKGDKKAGFPKFKSRYKYNSFYNDMSVYVNIEKNSIRIPKFKNEIKAKIHCKADGELRNITIKMANNSYYAVCLYKTEDIENNYEIDLNKAVGIDLGIKDFAILSNGTRYGNKNFLKNEQRKLARLNRKLSKKIGSKKGDKKSNNFLKAKLKLAKKHQHIANKRKDYLHKISHSLVKNYDVISVESLAVKNMIQNKHLSKAISDMGWGEFVRQLQYKAEWNNKILIKIDRWFPSSKTCSQCGYKNENLKLSERSWECPECGTVLDRDLNAAINIKNKGLHNLNAVGTVQPEQDKIKPADYAISGDQ